MENSTATSTPADELIFHDGLGDRALVRDTYGKPQYETLLIRPELCAIPSFEFSLNQRLTELEQFDHPTFVRARRLGRAPGPSPRLSVVGDYAGGTRLSDILASLESTGTRVPSGAPLFVIREILEGVSALHRQSPTMSHGALAPERVVVNGKIRITDYALGSAVEQLRFSPERYWKELRVAVPASAGASRLDKRTDVAQVGMIALALFAGRPLHDAEHMGGLSEPLEGLVLPESLKSWLVRALHLDPRRAYVSAVEAAQGLEEAIRESGVNPVPLVVSALGIRTTRVSSTVPRSPQPKVTAPLASVKKPLVRASSRQDRWNAHDVDVERRYAGQSQGLGADERHSWFGERLKTVLKVGLLGAALAGAFTAAQFVPAPAMLFSHTGTLVVESNPDGATVFVDEQNEGRTPLTLTLANGKHQVELRGSGKPRIFNVFISSGARVSQYVEMRGPRSR
jgi:serine/threonine protein kinase